MPRSRLRPADDEPRPLWGPKRPTSSREHRSDVIVGLGGDDVIDGLDGDDIICGGAGTDLIRGGPVTT